MFSGRVSNVITPGEAGQELCAKYYTLGKLPSKMKSGLSKTEICFTNDLNSIIFT